MYVCCAEYCIVLYVKCVVYYIISSVYFDTIHFIAYNVVSILYCVICTAGVIKRFISI